MFCHLMLVWSLLCTCRVCSLECVKGNHWEGLSNAPFKRKNSEYPQENSQVWSSFLHSCTMWFSFHFTYGTKLLQHRATDFPLIHGYWETIFCGIILNENSSKKYKRTLGKVFQVKREHDSDNQSIICKGKRGEFFLRKNIFYIPLQCLDIIRRLT